MQSWFPFIPESASTYSGDVDALYFYISGVTVFFTLLISFVIIFFVVKYRRRNAFEIPRPIEGSMKLETLWSVIPLLIAMSIFFWGAKIYYNQYRPPKNAIDVYVVGKQWMWKFQHATGQREINELHIPVGRKIRLIMATEDVIHDVFVPAFRIKADVVPGRYTTEWFEATKPGRYHFFCAEYCGMNHSGMGGYVVVMEPTDFENWLSGNANQMSPAATGQQMFESLGCASCHGANAEGGRGPALLGVYGNNVVLNNSQTIRADEGYLRESIMNPQAKIVNGFGPIMPSFQGQLSEEQLLQLVAYIKSLSAPKTETPTAKPPPPSARPSATPASTPKT
ncbi:MAG: cytochrome c oxidase subunit [Blastocatellia bacterium]|jgi:cytochrome c oxidase subunit 2|nr:cytochrome c oxidase subunit [Blastocatellia bacterium]